MWQVVASDLRDRTKLLRDGTDLCCLRLGLIRRSRVTSRHSAPHSLHSARVDVPADLARLGRPRQRGESCYTRMYSRRRS